MALARGPAAGLARHVVGMGFSLFFRHAASMASNEECLCFFLREKFGPDKRFHSGESHFRANFVVGVVGFVFRTLGKPVTEQIILSRGSASSPKLRIRVSILRARWVNGTIVFAQGFSHHDRKYQSLCWEVGQ